MKKIKFLLLLIILNIVLFPIVSFAKSASIIGCNYGFGNINTQPIAEYVSSRLSNMDYRIFNSYSPTPDIISGTTLDNQKFLESDVLDLVGHANSTTMSWTGCTNNNVGINSISNNTYDNGINYIGIGAYNLSNIKFVMLEGCETAKNDYNITKQFNNYGALASMGWTTEINTFSAKSWNTRFWNKIQSGGTISEANDEANSAWYAASSIKNTKIYGDSNIRLNPISYFHLYNKNILNKKNEYNYNIGLNSNKDSEIYEKISELIKSDINKDFDINDFNIEISSSNGKDIYDFGFKFNKINVELGYTVFIENNIIKKIYDNTEGINLNNIKSEIKNINISNLNLENNQKLVYDYKTKKLKLYSELTSISENGTKSKYYDIENVEKEV